MKAMMKAMMMATMMATMMAMMMDLGRKKILKNNERKKCFIQKKWTQYRKNQKK